MFTWYFPIHNTCFSSVGSFLGAGSIIKQRETAASDAGCLAMSTSGGLLLTLLKLPLSSSILKVQAPRQLSLGHRMGTGPSFSSVNEHIYGDIPGSCPLLHFWWPWSGSIYLFIYWQRTPAGQWHLAILPQRLPELEHKFRTGYRPHFILPTSLLSAPEFLWATIPSGYPVVLPECTRLCILLRAFLEKEVTAALPPCYDTQDFPGI